MKTIRVPLDRQKFIEESLKITNELNEEWVVSGVSVVNNSEIQDAYKTLQVGTMYDKPIYDQVKVSSEIVADECYLEISVVPLSEYELHSWKSEVDKIQQCPQRQDTLNDQLKDLIPVANKLGFYDAADYLKRDIHEN